MPDTKTSDHGHEDQGSPGDETIPAATINESVTWNDVDQFTDSIRENATTAER